MKYQYKIDKKEIMSWANKYYLFGARNIILFILWSVVAVMSVALIVRLSLSGGEWINWYLSVFFLALAIFKLFFSRYVACANRYKMLSKTYGVTEWMRTADFTDDEIILTDHTSVSRFGYQTIRKIKEKDNIVMIVFNNNLVFGFYRDAFVEGTWEECKEKITSMMQ